MLALLLALAACARGDTPKLRSIVPAGDEPLDERGSRDVAVAQVSIALVADLRREPHDDIDSQRWKMPASVAFDQACAGLQRALGTGWHEPATFGHEHVFVLARDAVPVRLAAYADPVHLAVTVFTRDN